MCFNKKNLFGFIKFRQPLVNVIRSSRKAPKTKMHANNAVLQDLLGIFLNVEFFVLIILLKHCYI